MQRNLGTIDRIVRILLGIVIIGAGFVFRSWWGVVGIVPLATGFIGFCGLYALFGISTCKIK